MQDRVRGHPHQGRSVIERLHADPWPQSAIAVDARDFSLQARHHLFGLHGAVHDHDAGDHIVAPVSACASQARHVPNLNLRDVFDQDRHAIVLAEHHIADVVNVAQQADAANVDRLLADVDRAPTDIDVGVANGRKQLRQGHVVGLQLGQICLHVVFLGGPTPSHDLGHTGHGEQAARDDPVLNRAQRGQAHGGRTNQLVAQDLTHQARGLNLGLNVVGKADVLLQVQCRLGVGVVIVDAVLEGHAHKRQPVKGR